MDYLHYLLLISTLLNIILIFIAVYLFIWRKSIGNNQTSIVPSELLSEFKKNQTDLVKLSKNLDQFEEHISKLKKEDSELIKESKEYLSILTNNTTKKDEEISRLKEGYDAYIFKRFLNRFFRVYRTIEEDLEFYTDKKNEPFIKLLNSLKSIIKEAFLDCGLEEFSPHQGEDYKKAFGISDSITNIETQIENKHMKIAEVKSSGFKMKNEYGNEVIKPAMVVVYKYTKKEVA